MRPSWDDYFIKIAQDVALRATCLRRCYGAVIVDKDHVIVSTGYCGAPRGEPNCTTLGVCERQRLNVPSGERYELCRSVHAEQNAVISGIPDRMKGGTIYVAGVHPETGELADAKPCFMCRRVIKNAQIESVVYLTKEGVKTVKTIDL
jgi:dCMP deaminase